MLSISRPFSILAPFHPSPKMPKRTLPYEAFSNTQLAVCKRYKAEWLSLPAEIQAAIHYMARPPHPTAQLMRQAFSNATNNWHIYEASRTTKREGLGRGLH